MSANVPAEVRKELEEGLAEVRAEKEPASEEPDAK